MDKLGEFLCGMKNAKLLVQIIQDDGYQMIRVDDRFQRCSLNDWVVGEGSDAAWTQDAPGLLQRRADGSGRMPNSAALFTDLFEWLAVDDVVITVVDVPAELKSGLKK